nr:serine-threonine/tyrosine-protein kinase catalytic domain-containing protein [Tanacetum cinerariifolium]
MFFKCAIERKVLKFAIYSPPSIIHGKLKNGEDIAICGPSLDRYTHQEYMNEASILLQVEHENLIQLLGYCIEGTRAYLIYDYAPYATLFTLLLDQDCALLGWDERHKILLGVARVVVYLHKHAPNRIIHCNVKPSNILLDERMNPKLLNFRIARSYSKKEDDISGIDYEVGTR